MSALNPGLFHSSGQSRGVASALIFGASFRGPVAQWLELAAHNG